MPHATRMTQWLSWKSIIDEKRALKCLSVWTDQKKMSYHVLLLKLLLLFGNRWRSLIKRFDVFEHEAFGKKARIDLSSHKHVCLATWVASLVCGDNRCSRHVLHHLQADLWSHKLEACTSVLKFGLLVLVWKMSSMTGGSRRSSMEITLHML